MRCWPTSPRTEKNPPVREHKPRPRPAPKPDTSSTKPKAKRSGDHYRLPDTVVDQALELRNQGLTYREIGAKLGWDQSGVRKVLIRRVGRTHVDPELRAEIRAKSLCPTCNGTGRQ